MTEKLKIPFLDFKGHVKPIWGLDFSPDGKYIISGSEDRTIRIWNLKTKSLEKLIEHKKAINTLDYSAANDLIVSGCADNNIYVWDALTGKLVQLLKGHTGPVLSTRFSWDGNYIVSGSVDTTVRLWDVESGQELKNFKGHNGPVRSVRISKDGTLIISGGDDFTVGIWFIKFEDHVQFLREHTAPITAVSFSHDGKYILSTSRDETAIIWDVTSGYSIKKLEKRTGVGGFISQRLKGVTGHEGSIWCAAYSPDDKYIITGGNDHNLVLWDVKGSNPLKKFEGHTDTVISVSYSPDGNYIASTSRDNTIRIWNVETGLVEHIFENGNQHHFDNVKLYENGRILATRLATGKIVSFNVITKNEINFNLRELTKPYNPSDSIDNLEVYTLADNLIFILDPSEKIPNPIRKFIYAIPASKKQWVPISEYTFVLVTALKDELQLTKLSKLWDTDE